MIIEARIWIELPDIGHSPSHIDDLIKSKYGVHILNASNPFFATSERQLAISWEYEDVDINLIKNQDGKSIPQRS